MSSFEIYSAIIQQKVYMKNYEKKFRQRLEKLQENLSHAVGHYIIGITYHLPVRTVMAIQLMKECKISIEKIDDVLKIIQADIDSLQEIIDNHFDEDAFMDYITNFSKTVDKIENILKEIDTSN